MQRLFGGQGRAVRVGPRLFDEAEERRNDSTNLGCLWSWCFKFVLGVGMREEHAPTHWNASARPIEGNKRKRYSAQGGKERSVWVSYLYPNGRHMFTPSGIGCEEVTQFTFFFNFSLLVFVFYFMVKLTLSTHSTYEKHAQ